MIPFRTPLILSSVLLMACGFLCCGSQPKPGPEPQGTISAASLAALPGTAMRLQHGSGTVDGLAAEALKALASGDTTALLGLLVSEQEFQKYLYPEFGLHYPAARDTSAQARQFVWEQHSLNAMKALRKAMRELGGRRMELVRVEFREGGRRFDSYTMYEGTEVTVRLENGEVAGLLAFGAIVEMDGVYKFLSYRDRT